MTIFIYLKNVDQLWEVYCSKGPSLFYGFLKAFDSEALNSEVGRGESVSVLQLVGWLERFDGLSTGEDCLEKP